MESGGGMRDNVQKAIDELRSAGEKATGDVRSSIDSAVARLRDASGDATSKATDQVSSFKDTLETATEDVRKELGKLAVRAQSFAGIVWTSSPRSSPSAARAWARSEQLAAELPVQRAQQALPGLVCLLVGADLSQLLARQAGQAGVDLADRELVVGADRQSWDAGPPAHPVGAREGLARRRRPRACGLCRCAPRPPRARGPRRRRARGAPVRPRASPCGAVGPRLRCPRRAAGRGFPRAARRCRPPARGPSRRSGRRAARRRHGSSARARPLRPRPPAGARARS